LGNLLANFLDSGIEINDARSEMSEMWSAESLAEILSLRDIESWLHYFCKTLKFLKFGDKFEGA